MNADETVTRHEFELPTGQRVVGVSTPDGRIDLGSENTRLEDEFRTWEPGKVQVIMKASVGTLRSGSTVWVAPERADVLVGKNLAAYPAARPAAVPFVDAVGMTAQNMRDRHKLQAAEEGAGDGEKTDPGEGEAKPRRRAGNGNGGSNKAGRLDKPANGEQG